jgi:hypothetical protein
MTDQTFRAIIEVVNRATAPLHKIRGDFYGLIAPISAVGVAMGALSTEIGLVTLSEHAVLAAERVGHLGRELGALLGPVALIGGIASAEGLLEVGKKSAEFGEKLLHQSDKTGVDVPVLARLHYVATLEDVDPDMLDKSLTRLNSSLFKAMRGKNKDLDGMLRHFSGANWHKSVKSVEDGFGLIADAYKKAKTPFEKASVVSTAFGQKMGANLIPMLLKGKDAVRELGNEFDRFNGVWTRERAEQAAEAADNWKRLSLAGSGLAMTVGSAITPSLMKLIVPLTDWIAKNRELVAAKVDHAVTQIGDALKNVDWKGIAEAIKSVWGAFKGLAELLGAKGTVFLGAAVVFGPIAKSALLAAWSLGVLAVDIGLVTARLGILAATQVAGFFGALAAGFRLALGPMLAFDLALSANPIGAIILAVTALAGAAYLIYRYWDPISKWFSDLWAGIKSTIEAAWVFMKPIVEKITHALDGLRGANYDKFAGNQSGDTNLPAWLTGRAEKGAPLNPAGASAPKSVVDMHRSLGLVKGANGQVHVAGSDRIAGGQGAASAPARGQVDVSVKLEGLPRGSQTHAETSGSGLNLKVGKSFAHE